MTQPWEERFEILLRESLGNEVPVAIDPDADMSELGLDSMGLVTLLLSLEEEYQVELPVEDLYYDNIATPQRLWQLVVDLRDSLVGTPAEAGVAVEAGVVTEGS